MKGGPAQRAALGNGGIEHTRLETMAYDARAWSSHLKMIW